MSEETPKDDERETPEAEAELEPTAADEAAADAAADEEEDDVLDEEPEAEAGDEEPEAEAEDEEPEAEADDEEPQAEADEEPAAEEKPKRRRTSRKAAEPAEEPAPELREPGELVVVRAQAKYVRTSARKARLVCDHIRGKSVQDARAILAHTPRAVARDWSKLLESAVANAEHNHELLGDDLRIVAVTADEGPTLKRYRPRAMGRATRIRKRTSHLTILLTPKEF